MHKSVSEIKDEIKRKSATNIESKSFLVERVDMIRLLAYIESLERLQEVGSENHRNT